MDTEVLETNEIVVPKELSEYLEEDEKALEIFNTKIEDVVSREAELKNEIEEKEKEFERRLEEFKASLEKEKEDQAKIFSDRESELSKEKENLESIKSEQESKKQSYISSLMNINDAYASKMGLIKNAIDIASDNESLKRALEEEQEKLNDDLSKEYENRKTELSTVLESIGEKKEEPVIEEPKVTEVPVEEPTVIPTSEIIETHDDNEVVSHESREDVINEIYGSKEVMEGHVFPYLNGLIGE